MKQPERMPSCTAPEQGAGRRRQLMDPRLPRWCWCGTDLGQYVLLQTPLVHGSL